ncbi:MAG TPA: inner-membrane translocator [Ktedonobacteraceae bacterium]|nr:inner-membrane translocator [Ktedonobacteraceae bacterium]
MSDTIENTPDSGTASGKAPAVMAEKVEVPESRQKQTIGQLLRNDLGFIPVLITLIIVMVFFQATTNGLFFSPRNISNLFFQTATIGLVGLGVILVLLLGEIDLSVAAVSTLCGVILGVLSERLGGGLPPWVSIPGALLAGALIGFLNGYFVAVLRIPSFIVTLATSITYSGLLITLLAGQATLEIQNTFIDNIAGSPTSYLPDYLGIGLPTIAVLLYVLSLIINYRKRKRIGLSNPGVPQFLVQLIVPILVVEGAVVIFESYNGVPYSTAILFGAILLFWIILTKTPFGRHIYAVGGNKEAARRAGINVVAIQLIVFTLCSLLASAGGIIEASYTTSASSQVSNTLLLDAIAAPVIGGVSLFGGIGSAWSLVLGMLIIGSLANGLALKNLGADTVQIVEGIVLIVAVTADAVIRRLQARTGR